ncbi:g597 [Coccomyxa elongata]
MSLTRVEFYPEAECRRSWLLLGFVRSRREAREARMGAAGWVKVYEEPSIRRLPVADLSDVPILTKIYGKEMQVSLRTTSAKDQFRCRRLVP